MQNNSAKDTTEKCFTCPSDLRENFKMKIQGSEAKIYEGKYLEKDAILKERFQKKYRHVELDKILTAERTRAEVRALNKCFDIGIKCPAIYFADLQTGCIILEKIPNAMTIKELLTEYYQKEGIAGITSLSPLAHKIGSVIALMHQNSLIHGDLTTSNMLIKKEDVSNIFLQKSFDLFFIDFGLSKRDVVLEDKAVDLYVLERAISSSHPNSEDFFSVIMKGYLSIGEANAVLNKLEEVRQRGRKRTMVG